MRSGAAKESGTVASWYLGRGRPRWLPEHHSEYHRESWQLQFPERGSGALVGWSKAQLCTRHPHFLQRLLTREQKGWSMVLTPAGHVGLEHAVHEAEWKEPPSWKRQVRGGRQ